MLKTNKIITAAVAAATLVGGIAAASEASAQSRYRYRDRDNTGAAVAAGVAGLALGAALASNNRGYYGGGYYAPSYNSGYYGPGPAYGGYYGRGYYAPPRGYYGRPYYGGGYGRSCVYWNYDRWGRAYQVRGRC